MTHRLLALFWWAFNSPIIQAIPIAVIVISLGFIMSKTLIIETSNDISYHRVDAGELVLVGSDVGSPDPYTPPAPAAPPVYPGQGIPTTFNVSPHPGLEITTEGLTIQSALLPVTGGDDEAEYYDLSVPPFYAYGGMLTAGSYGAILTTEGGVDNTSSVAIGVRTASGAFFGTGVIGVSLAGGGGMGYGAIVVAPSGAVYRDQRSNIFPDDWVRYLRTFERKHGSTSQPNDTNSGRSWYAGELIAPDGDVVTGPETFAIVPGQADGLAGNGLFDAGGLATIGGADFGALVEALTSEELIPTVYVAGTGQGVDWTGVIKTALIR